MAEIPLDMLKLTLTVEHQGTEVAKVEAEVNRALLQETRSRDYMLEHVVSVNAPKLIKKLTNWHDEKRNS
jgi:predicted secreted protein